MTHTQEQASITIRYSRVDGTTGSCAIPVAHLSENGVLAVHRVPRGLGCATRPLQHWTITHVPTGMAVLADCTLTTKRRAIALCADLAGLDWTTVHPDTGAVPYELADRVLDVFIAHNLLPITAQVTARVASR